MLLFICYRSKYVSDEIKKTRSIQRTQTPPSLWPLTLMCDLDLKVKVKNAYDIRCRLLYCTLVLGMMSVSVIVYEIWPLVHFCDLWPSPVTFIVVCMLDVVCVSRRVGWRADRCTLSWVHQVHPRERSPSMVAQYQFTVDLPRRA